MAFSSRCSLHNRSPDSPEPSSDALSRQCFGSTEPGRRGAIYRMNSASGQASITASAAGACAVGGRLCSKLAAPPCRTVASRTATAQHARRIAHPPVPHRAMPKLKLSAAHAVEYAPKSMPALMLPAKSCGSSSAPANIPTCATHRLFCLIFQPLTPLLTGDMSPTSSARNCSAADAPFIPRRKKTCSTRRLGTPPFMRIATSSRMSFHASKTSAGSLSAGTRPDGVGSALSTSPQPS